MNPIPIIRGIPAYFALALCSLPTSAKPQALQGRAPQEGPCSLYAYPVPHLPTSPFPQQVFAADLDGDGHSDVLSVSVLGTASVLRGAGNQRFRPHRDYDIGDPDPAAALGDMDGDLDLDLVTVSLSTDRLTILRNFGKGDFGPPEHQSTLNNPSALALGDCDGDGDLDVAVVHPDLERVQLRWNAGDGTLVGWKNVSVGADPESVILVDVDGDGDLDLVVANTSLDRLALCLNLGNGNYGSAVSIGSVTRPLRVVSGDFDADGDSDLLAESYYTGHWVLLNDGLGGFSNPAPGWIGPNLLSMSTQDLDGDGLLDVLGTSNVFSIEVLRGGGDGSFATVASLWIGDWSPSAAAADWNGDGRPDLAFIDHLQGAIGFVYSNAKHGFEFPDRLQVGPHGLIQVAADLDGDHIPDWVAADPSGQSVYVLRNSGDGQLLPPEEYFGGHYPSALASADFDADGQDDVVSALEFTDRISILFGRSGRLSDPQVHDTVMDPTSVATADLDGDGHQDIVSAGGVGNLGLHLNAGDGSFAPMVPLPLPGVLRQVLAFDIEGDGDLDLAVLAAGSLRIIRNLGGGVFGAPESYTIGANPRSLRVVDVDGDGYAELVSVDLGEPYVSLFANRGDGTLAPRIAVPLTASAGALAVGDWNQDGRSDLAITREDSATGRAEIELLQNTGAATFTVRLSLMCPGSPNMLDSCDLDGDGDLELILSDTQGGYLSVFRSECR